MNIQLPTPLAGDVSAITITSPDLEISLPYYQQLGFTEVMRADFPFPWIQVSDGALLLMLRKDKDPFIGLTYYAEDMEKALAALQEAGLTPVEKPTPHALIRRYLLLSPDGHPVTLVSNVDGIFKQPPGPTLLTMPPQNITNPDMYVNKVCGIFGEFAHPVKDLDSSVVFWEKIGLKVLSKHAVPYPWAILSDGLAIVGLHQTSTFSQPTITYFAGDMKARIERLRSQGTVAMPEATAASITITTPENQKINLFNMGM